MPLVEETLLGTTDRVSMALTRLHVFEPEDGYYVAFSGGKDSIVTLDLIRRSGVRHDAHYSVTTVDPPELTRFIREQYADVEQHRPELSMYQLIVKKRLPPTRSHRYCCEQLKERGGDGRMVVTGIRRAESVRRSRRMIVEACKFGKGKTYLHPIIDWSDEDVWEYIRDRGLPYPSLYDEGQTRIGCVMCPLASKTQIMRDAERWPRFAAMYERACVVAFEQAVADGLERHTWKDGHDMYHWWVEGCNAAKTDPQLFPLDN